MPWVAGRENGLEPRPSIAEHNAQLS